MTAKIISLIPEIAIIQLADGNKTIIEQVHVQVAISVEIEKCGVCRKSFICQTIRLCLFNERLVPLIYEQFIGSVILLPVSRITYININVSVAINICKCYTCTP